MDDETRIADLLEIVEKHVVSCQREYVAILVKMAFNRGKQVGVEWSCQQISGRPH